MLVNVDILYPQYTPSKCNDTNVLDFCEPSKEMYTKSNGRAQSSRVDNFNEALFTRSWVNQIFENTPIYYVIADQPLEFIDISFTVSSSSGVMFYNNGSDSDTIIQ